MAGLFYGPATFVFIVLDRRAFSFLAFSLFLPALYHYLSENTFLFFLQLLFPFCESPQSYFRIFLSVPCFPECSFSALYHTFPVLYQAFLLHILPIYFWKDSLYNWNYILFLYYNFYFILNIYSKIIKKSLSY